MAASWLRDFFIHGSSGLVMRKKDEPLTSVELTAYTIATINGGVTSMTNVRMSRDHLSVSPDISSPDRIRNLVAFINSNGGTTRRLLRDDRQIDAEVANVIIQTDGAALKVRKDLVSDAYDAANQFLFDRGGDVTNAYGDGHILRIRLGPYTRRLTSSAEVARFMSEAARRAIAQLLLIDSNITEVEVFGPPTAYEFFHDVMPLVAPRKEVIVLANGRTIQPYTSVELTAFAVKYRRRMTKEVDPWDLRAIDVTVDTSTGDIHLKTSMSSLAILDELSHAVLSLANGPDGGVGGYQLNPPPSMSSVIVARQIDRARLINSQTLRVLGYAEKFGGTVLYAGATMRLYASDTTEDAPLLSFVNNTWQSKEVDGVARVVSDAWMMKAEVRAAIGQLLLLDPLMTRVEMYGTPPFPRGMVTFNADTTTVSEFFEALPYAQVNAYVGELDDAMAGELFVGMMRDIHELEPEDVYLAAIRSKPSINITSMMPFNLHLRHATGISNATRDEIVVRMRRRLRMAQNPMIEIDGEVRPWEKRNAGQTLLRHVRSFIADQWISHLEITHDDDAENGEIFTLRDTMVDGAPADWATRQTVVVTNPEAELAQTSHLRRQSVRRTIGLIMAVTGARIRVFHGPSRSERYEMWHVESDDEESLRSTKNAHAFRRRLAAHLLSIPGMLIDAANDPMAPWRGMRVFRGVGITEGVQPEYAGTRCTLEWSRFTAFTSPFYTVASTYDAHVFTYRIKESAADGPLRILDLRDDHVNFGTLPATHPLTIFFALTGILPVTRQVRTDMMKTGILALFADAGLDAVAFNHDLELAWLEPSNTLVYVPPTAAMTMTRQLMEAADGDNAAYLRCGRIRMAHFGQVDAMLITQERITAFLASRHATARGTSAVVPFVTRAAPSEYTRAQFAHRMDDGSSSSSSAFSALWVTQYASIKRGTPVYSCDYHALWRFLAPLMEPDRYDNIYMGTARAGRTMAARGVILAPTPYDLLVTILRGMNDGGGVYLLVGMPNGHVQLVPPVPDGAPLALTMRSSRSLTSTWATKRGGAPDDDSRPSKQPRGDE